MPLTRPESLEEDYELAYRVIAAPADTNYRGDIFGGWLMAQVDVAGSILAVREASGRVATVAVKEFRFLAPVKVGDLISCYGRIELVGKTSVNVHVKVYAVQQPDDFSRRHVSEATLVYVALDERGRPRAVHSRQ